MIFQRGLKHEIGVIAYFLAMGKVLFKINFLHMTSICLSIFKTFAKHFRALKMKKEKLK